MNDNKNEYEEAIDNMKKSQTQQQKEQDFLQMKLEHLEEEQHERESNWNKERSNLQQKVKDFNKVNEIRKMNLHIRLKNMIFLKKKQ